MLSSNLLLVIAAVHGASAAIIPRAPVKIVQSNDDGWGVANLRRLFDVLNASAFSTIISAPARQNSGKGSLDAPPPATMSTAGDFNLIPAHSPGVGFNASDPRLNYVDSFPVTAVKYGIKLAPAPKLLGGAPELIVSGPNVGSNLGLVTLISGTIGIATEAIKQGIPAIAFSGAGGKQHSFTEPDPVADLYAQVALKIVQAITSSKPFLPAGVALNVNFPKSDATTCTKLSDFYFILSRVNFDINPFTPDVQHCGTNHLPAESHVIDSGNCRVSISVFKESKFDASADKQQAVRDKLTSLLGCM